MDDEQITYFAETDSRNKRLRFGIKAKDRSRHVYVIGKTGMGKSTLLENLAIQDIQNGNGMAFIDPHGKTADLLLEYVPEGRIKDVLYFAPFDLDYPVSFNVMEDVGPDKRHLVANGMMSAFKKIWVDAWSARMEYILNNILLALLEYPGSTLLGVNRMLADKDYRNKVVANISDPSVKSFWVDEFAKYGERYMQEAGAAIQNKIGQFVSNPLIRNIIGQPRSTFDIRHMMDEQKIIIVNLSKGRMGEANANLLGGMLITKLYLGAMSRADVPEKVLKNLPNFYLHVDEFQNFANESFADILSEARKYKLNLTIAHQYIEQMTEEVKAAVFGNVGSMITFRVGAYDAEVLEKEFAPVFTMEDIVNLDKFQIYLRLMINGVGSQPFSATTINTPPTPEINFVSEIIDTSRSQFARPRQMVEDEIKDWHRPIEEVEKDRKNNNRENGNSAVQERSRNIGGGQYSNNKQNHHNGNGRNGDLKPRNVGPIKPLPKEFIRENGHPGVVPHSMRNPDEASTHNPFKKAFSSEEREKVHLERELELRKAISLNFLKKDEHKEDKNHNENNHSNNTEKKDKKGVTEESLLGLRSALQAVLDDTKHVDSTQDKSSTDTNNQPITTSAKVESKVKKEIGEIPEKELRDILSIEEE